LIAIDRTKQHFILEIQKNINFSNMDFAAPFTD